MPTLRGTRARLELRSTAAPPGDYQGGAVVERLVDLLLGSGTGANQADVLYSDYRALASTNEDLDLKTITDAFGVALALVEVVAIMIEAPSTNSGNIILEPGASNGWAAMFGVAGLVLLPGASALITCPGAAAYAVGASTKVLNVENTGTGGYTLTIVGRTA